MATLDPPSATWRTSTRSSGNGNCLAFADLEGTVAVRDTKDPDGPVLLFTAGSWNQFVDAAGTGLFVTR